MRYKCKKCKHEWSPRTPNPLRCANKECRCRQWNIYTKSTVKHKPPTEKGILNGKHYGRLLITMMNIETYGKRYAEILDRSEGQISTMLKTLQEARIVSEYTPNNLDSTSKPLGKKKQWRINQEKISKLCQEHAEQNLKIKSEQIIETIINNKQEKNTFLRFDDDKKILNNKKDQFTQKMRDKEFQDYKAFREELAEKIRKTTLNQLKRIKILFKARNYEQFLILYINAFYPDLNFSLAELTDFYIEWGEEL